MPVEVKVDDGVNHVDLIFEAVCPGEPPLRVVHDQRLHPEVHEFLRKYNVVAKTVFTVAVFGE